MHTYKCSHVCNIYYTHICFLIPFWIMNRSFWLWSMGYLLAMIWRVISISLLPWVCTMKPQGCLSNMPLVLALLKWSLEFCHSWDVHADCPRLPKTWFRILLLSLWRLDPLWTFSRFKLMPTKNANEPFERDTSTSVLQMIYVWLSISHLDWCRCQVQSMCQESFHHACHEFGKRWETQQTA